MVARIRAPLVHTRPHAPRETDHRTVPMGPARHSAGNSLDNNHLLFLNGVDALPDLPANSPAGQGGRDTRKRRVATI